VSVGEGLTIPTVCTTTDITSSYISYIYVCGQGRGKGVPLYMDFLMRLLQGITPGATDKAMLGIEK
jgi:hypothetical protein